MQYKGVVCLIFYLASITTGLSSVILKVNPANGFLEISNGLVGIAIPWEQAIKNAKYDLAPIQSVLYPGNEYSDNTINYLQTGIELTSKGVKPYSLKATILRQSNTEAIVTLEYKFNKPKFVYGENKYNRSNEGRGYYKIEFAIRKGEKSILITEDADYDIYYYFKISNGLNPDQARYRGWNSISPKYGYEPGGGVYRSENERPYSLDAIVDLDYTGNTKYGQLSLWEPAGGEVNTGRYWLIYNSMVKNSKLIGFFHGKPSLLIGARLSGPQLVTNRLDRDSTEKKCTEILVNMTRRTADNMWFPRKRYQWGLYISNTSELLPNDKDQLIMKELNYYSGLGSRIKSYADKPIKLNASVGDGALYLPVSDVKKMIIKIKDNYPFYLELMYRDGAYRDIWNAWYHKDSAAIIVKRLLGLKKYLVDNYITGDGIYKYDTRYWLGVRNFKIWAISISGVLADKSIPLTNENRKTLESIIGLMARIVWDDENVPLSDSAGVNLGPPNMVHQYLNNGRNFFALLCREDPEFISRANKIKTDLLKEIDNVLFDNGSSFGNPHYTQTALDPIWLTMLQLKQAGMGNLFEHPKVKAHVGFLLGLLTPPSVRFNLNRKLICFGDGTEESCGSFGLLATGLNESNKSLTMELNKAYYYGPPGYIFAGPGPLAIPMYESNTAISINLSSCSYNGYYSSFRLGNPGTLESALWVLNGDKLFDHRHDDRGQIAIYALGAPLCLNYSSFYTPRSSNAKTKSMILPVDYFPEWAGENQVIDGGGNYNSSEQIEFAELSNVVHSKIRIKDVKGNTWIRKVTQLAIDSFPVYFIHDSSSYKDYIWSMPMMSKGSIGTPLGKIYATEKWYKNEEKKELPGAAGLYKLNKGWNKFEFNGQEWPMHVSGGIDWTLMSSVNDESQFSLTHWGHFTQNTYEVNDFQKANNRPYSEEQQIIRIKTSGPLFNVLVPYLKGKNMYTFMKESPQSLRIKKNEHHITAFSNSIIDEISTDSLSIVSLDESEKTYKGISIKGGTFEVIIGRSSVSVSIHGNSSNPVLSLPFKVKEKIKSEFIILLHNNNNSIIKIKYLNSSKDQPLNSKRNKTYLFAREQI